MGFHIICTCCCLKMIWGSIVGFPVQLYFLSLSLGVSSWYFYGEAWQSKGYIVCILLYLSLNDFFWRADPYCVVSFFTVRRFNGDSNRQPRTFSCTDAEISMSKCSIGKPVWAGSRAWSMNVRWWWFPLDLHWRLFQLISEKIEPWFSDYRAYSLVPILTGLPRSEWHIILVDTGIVVFSGEISDLTVKYYHHNTRYHR